MLSEIVNSSYKKVNQESFGIHVQHSSKPLNAEA